MGPKEAPPTLVSAPADDEAAEEAEAAKPAAATPEPTAPVPAAAAGAVHAPSGKEEKGEKEKGASAAVDSTEDNAEGVRTAQSTHTCTMHAHSTHYPHPSFTLSLHEATKTAHVLN